MTVADAARAPASGRSSSREDHEQCFRSDPSAAADGAAGTHPCRRAMYALAEGIAPIGRPRVALCRRRRLTGSVAVLTYPDANGAPHALYHGLLLCGSVWECPLCRLQICAHRAAEVERVVEAHRAAYGDDTVLLLTLTVRHGIGHDLRAVRQGVANAWRLTTQNSWWAGLDQQLGVPLTRCRAREARSQPKLGIIRALEVTHGDHGWHVHIHAVVLLRCALADDDRNALASRLDERWRKRVVRVLGAQHAPDRDHGVDLRPLRCCPDYIAKLGLEIADPGTKLAKHGNRTPLEIAHAYATTKKRPEDGTLWQTYCAGMRGARMLTWTHGLRSHYGLDEALEDHEIVDDAESRGHSLVGVIPGSVWNALRVLPRARVTVLEAAERGGASEVTRVIRRLVGSEVGRSGRVFVPAQEMRGGFG